MLKLSKRNQNHGCAKRTTLPHCTGGGIRSDSGSSARSGCAKQRSLLCPLSENRRPIPTKAPCGHFWRHLLSPKGGAKSVRRAKKSGNGRRLAPKTLRGRARARVFDGASAARSSSRFFAMRRQLCALRNGDLFRFEFFSSHLAGLRPAGMHCENSGSSDGIGASARSGCTKQRSLLCAARNQDYSFH